MLDLLLPKSDAAVFAQIAIVTPLWLGVLYLVRRNRDLLLFVFGLGLVGAALTAFRAVH